MDVFDDGSLASESVLITGATGGIGVKVAQQLSGMGASIFLTGRNQEKLNKLEDELKQYHDSTPEITSATCDITIENDREKVVKQAINKIGPITGLVNSAGIDGDRCPFETLSQDQLEDIMRVNFTATLLFTQRIYKHMIEQDGGSIVNISSLSGLRGTYQNVPYSSSKFALTGFTQSLAVEAIENSVRVNSIAPGWVDTDMAKDGVESKAEELGNTYKEQRKIEEGKIPSGKFTDPEEVAATTGFLLTDAAHNIVGENIKISGGSVVM